MRVWIRWPTDGLLRSMKATLEAHWVLGGGGGDAHGQEAASNHVPGLEMACHPPGQKGH